MKNEKKPLKILHIGSKYFPHIGGSSLRISQLLEPLVKNTRCEIHLLTTTPNKNGEFLKITPEIINGIYVYRAKNLYDMRKVLLNICKKTSIDIIHAHNPRVGLLVRMTMPSIPFVVELHGFEEMNILKKLLTKYVFRQSSSVIVLAESAKSKISRDYNISLRKICSLPNGIDLEKFNLSFDNKVSSDIKTVGYIGSFWHFQGVTDFVKSIPYIIKENADVRFLMVGDGPEMKKIKELIDHLQIGSKIHLTGNVNPSEIPKYFSKIDVFVMPRPSTLATETTIPLKIYEAMAAGTAIVASQVGGLMEVLTPNEDCLSFKPGDINELSQAVLRLLNDEDCRKKISMNARKRCLRTDSWGDVSEKLFAVYRDISLF